MIIFCWRNKKGQATTELAIMGAILLMGLLFLAQQGFLYNAKQGLEMYTFRQALALSRSTGRGVQLSVMREVVMPSFFSGLSRQKIQAASSVEANPWDMYTAEKNTPQDMDTLQLVQIGEAMIQHGVFIQVPPTQVTVHQTDGKTNDTWKTSTLTEIDSQSDTSIGVKRTSSYNYYKTNRETPTKITAVKDLTSVDQSILNVKLEQDVAKIISDYKKNDWEGKISSVSIDASTLPGNADISLQENLSRIKTINTLK